MPILPTHKDSIIYLEHCKISAREGMVVLTRKKEALEKVLLEKHFSLHYANINALILGSGTSLSQQAARLLSGQGVSVAFTGGGGKKRKPEKPFFLLRPKPPFLKNWRKPSGKTILTPILKSSQSLSKKEVQNISNGFPEKFLQIGRASCRERVCQYV